MHVLRKAQVPRTIPMTNGNYYYIKTPNDLISVISLWSSRGSSSDPKGKEGLSHYFEHLFLNKTKTLPNKIAVLREIDGSGLFFNAYTRKNSVYYYFIQRAQDQEKAYRILIQGLADFSVEKNDVDRERVIILQADGVPDSSNDSGWKKIIRIGYMAVLNLFMRLDISEFHYQQQENIYQRY